MSNQFNEGIKENLLERACELSIPRLVRELSVERREALMKAFSEQPRYKSLLEQRLALESEWVEQEFGNRG